MSWRLTICALLISGLTMASCASAPVGTSTPTPAQAAMMGAITASATYAAAKAACESSGKDYKCEQPMTDCKCVERPKPAEPVIVTAPNPIVPPAPEPSLNPTPTLPSVAPVMPVSRGTILQPGESLPLPSGNGRVEFFVKGLRTFNTNPDRDHIFLFIKWMLDGKEANINIDMTNGVTRLISQDFAVPSGGRSFSEHQDVNPVQWDSAVTYRFLITWGEGKVHMEAWDGDRRHAAWDNVTWRSLGEPDVAIVGSAYHPYDMPDVLEIITD